MSQWEETRCQSSCSDSMLGGIPTCIWTYEALPRDMLSWKTHGTLELAWLRIWESDWPIECVSWLTLQSRDLQLESIMTLNIFGGLVLTASHESTIHSCRCIHSSEVDTRIPTILPQDALLYFPYQPVATSKQPPWGSWTSTFQTRRSCSFQDYY